MALPALPASKAAPECVDPLGWSVLYTSYTYRALVNISNPDLKRRAHSAAAVRMWSVSIPGASLSSTPPAVAPRSNKVGGRRRAPCYPQAAPDPSDPVASVGSTGYWSSWLECQARTWLFRFRACLAPKIRIPVASVLATGHPRRMSGSLSNRRPRKFIHLLSSRAPCLPCSGPWYEL